MSNRQTGYLLKPEQFITYLFPPVLIIFNYLSFHFFVSISNNKGGYLSGMILYWLLWCLLPFFLLISKKNRRFLLKIRKLNWWQGVLVFIPVILAVLFGPFKNRIGEVTPLIITFSLIYAFVNACCEEFLWRGIYFDHHPGNFFYAVIVPSIWFGIWHYVPLSVLSGSISNFYFILTAMGMGFCWAVVTYYTRSVFWSIISHTLVDLIGFHALNFF